MQEICWNLHPILNQHVSKMFLSSEVPMACRNVSKILHFGPTSSIIINTGGSMKQEGGGAEHAVVPRHPEMYAHISRRRSLPSSMRSPSLSVRAWHERRRGLLGIQIITWFVRSRRASKGGQGVEGGGERKRVRSVG